MARRKAKKAAPKAAKAVMGPKMAKAKTMLPKPVMPSKEPGFTPMARPGVPASGTPGAIPPGDRTPTPMIQAFHEGAKTNT